jgi:hypothetical protein
LLIFTIIVSAYFGYFSAKSFVNISLVDSSGFISQVHLQLISAFFVVSKTTQAGLQPSFVELRFASNHQVLEFSL